MAPRVFHPCQFNFQDEDIRVDGSTIDGGTSISGYQDLVRTDGGGIWRADFTNADFGGPNDEDRAATLAWRAVNAGMLGGSTPIVVRFCDRFHQPVTGSTETTHSDGSEFSDDTPYESSGASAVVVAVVNGQAGGLRATTIDVVPTTQRPLIGGERFTHVHGEWGERAYEIYSIEPVGGSTIRLTFQPPIRGGIAVGDELDLDNIRCRMRRVSPPSNPLSIGLYASASISFQEDMRPPVAA